MQTTELMGLPYLEEGDHVEDIATQSKSFVTGVESVMLTGDFRGLPGDQGDPGPPGLPGVNAVPTDEAIATYVAAVGTGTRAALDVLYAVDAATSTTDGLMSASDKAAIDELPDKLTSIAAQATASARVRASCTFGEYLGCMYSLVRAGDGRPTPGLVSKAFGGSSLPGVGAACIPVRQNLDVYAAKTMKPLVFNASGWKVTGNIGEARGAQILNGEIYHDFEDFADSPAGIEALGIRADGSVEVYSKLVNDSAQSMVDDGVQISFSYGPILVQDGVKRLLTDPRWTYFADATISARQIIGTDSAGNFMVCTVEGVSGTTGLTGKQAADLAAQLGYYKAVLMDGGGSAQAHANGITAMPSTDAGGKRPVPDALMLNAELIDPTVDTGWWDVAYNSPGYLANSQKLQIRERGGTTYMQGDVKPATGNFGVAADVTVATIRSRFRHSAAAKPFIVVGNGENVRKATVSSSGAVGVVAMATSATPPYLNLGNITWSK